MNVRTSTLDNRPEEKTGRAKRAETKTLRAEAKARRAEDKTKRAKGRAAQVDRPRGGRDLAVREGADPSGPVRSGAAQRAYERRQQRAALHRGDGAALDATSKRGSRFAARIPFVATVIGLLACGLMCTLLLTTRAAEDSYQLSAARAYNQHLSQEQASLQRDVETADSAPDLAAKARALGMIPAKDPARLLVAPDGGVVVVGKPVPAQGPPVPLLNGQGRDNVIVGTQRSAPPATRAAEQSPAGDTPQRAAANARAQGEQLVPMAIPGQGTGGQPR